MPGQDCWNGGGVTAALSHSCPVMGLTICQEWGLISETHDLVLKTNSWDLSPDSGMKKKKKICRMPMSQLAVLWLPLHRAGSGQRATQPPKPCSLPKTILTDPGLKSKLGATLSIHLLLWGLVFFIPEQQIFKETSSGLVIDVLGRPKEIRRLSGDLRS